MQSNKNIIYNKDKYIKKICQDAARQNRIN